MPLQSLSMPSQTSGLPGKILLLVSSQSGPTQPSPTPRPSPSASTQQTPLSGMHCLAGKSPALTPCPAASGLLFTGPPVLLAQPTIAARDTNARPRAAWVIQASDWQLWYQNRMEGSSARRSSARPAPGRTAPVGPWLVALGAALWGTESAWRIPLGGMFSSEVVVFYEHVILVALFLPVILSRARELRTVVPRVYG